jgi:hypothetical protein
MSKALRIIEDGDDFRRQPHQGNFGRVGARHRSVFGIPLKKDFSHIVDFRLVAHFGYARGHRDTFNLHRIGIIVADRDRHTRISRDIGELLAGTTDQEIDDHPVIGVADNGVLRPAVGAVGRNCHNAMMIEKIDNLPFECRIHDATDFRQTIV